MKKLLFTILFAGAVAAFAGFEMKEGVLTVSTPKIRLEMQDGMIVALSVNGEQFNGPFGNIPEKPYRKSLVPDGVTAGVFSKTGSDSARVSYALEGNGKLYYDFKIDGDDILIRVGVEKINFKNLSENLDIHVLFLKTEAVITGIGSRTLRKDPARDENMFWPGSSFNFPRVLIAEGKKNVLMFSCDDSQPYHNIFLYHTPESDHVVLRAGDENIYRRLGKMELVKDNRHETAFFRLSVHKDWLGAAKYWRKKFEERTGAVPLWQSPSKYARKIHAVFTGSANLPWKEDPDLYYKTLASEYNPENVILLYWNAPSILTFGDHRYSLKQNPAKVNELALKKNGFQWMAFHGYSLLCNEEAIPERHAQIGKKFIPEGYTFQPDYEGKPEDFYKKMAPYISVRSKPLCMVNPASKYVENYLVRNIINYARFHDIAGFYLDISGGVSYALKPGKLVFDGKTYTEGDVEVFKRLRKDAPDLLLMSEFCGEWIVPYLFYTWEAHLPHRHKDVRINHPLRAALLGSYLWARETMVVDDPIKQAYYATLPMILADIGSAHLEKHLVDEWYNERAKLFIREKLFNALPEQWDPEVLAYYRSEKNGFFQFRKMPYGYAYLDARKNTELGIYENVGKGIPGFLIPNWCAYDETGAAIGLNPERSYRFVKNGKKLLFTIVGLPEGCYLESVRNQENRSTVRLNSKTKKNGTVTVKFDAPPNRVLLNGKIQNVTGTQMTFTTDFPASLLVFHKQPKVHPELHRNWGWESGYDGLNGLHASHGYRGYYFNFSITNSRYTFDGQQKDCINIGSGRFGGYIEKMSMVPAGKKLLKCSFALKNTGKNIAGRLIVTINGKEILNRIVKNGDHWQDLELDISEFAGQEALFNFAFRYADPAQSIDQNINNTIHIGGFRFE